MNELSTGQVSDIFSEFETDVLNYDPFAGDFGGSDDLIFCDKMVRAAKPYDDCHTCGGGIEKGERHRYSSQKFDGELMSFRWCWACCTAMARVWNDDEDHPGLEIEAREGMRAPE